MQYNNKIDVIIPVYNTPDHLLFRCLSSIASQEIIQDLEITIVDDASSVKNNYQKIINNFTSIVKINLLRYEENGGPGVARQYGINHTSNEFITFIDVDDTLNGTFALKALRDGIQSNNNYYQVCIGSFDEVYKDPQSQETFLIPHTNDTIWMFGKLYRRCFIQKYNIHFHPTSRANEDNGFNTQIKLYSNNCQLINFIPAHVYYWHDNPNSITRNNDNQYTFGSQKWHSFYGYVENMIFAIQEAQKVTPNNQTIIKSLALEHIIRLYEYYLECYNYAPQNISQNFEYCKWYYNEIFKNYENEYTELEFKQMYSAIMKAFYTGGNLDNIIPFITFYEFLNQLKR